MQRRNLILLGVALFVALIAVSLANSYFSGVERRQERIAKQQQLSRIVVASQDMAFGMQLGSQNLKLANWPSNSLPVGAFTSIEEAMRDNRVALRPIVTGEPVLASKVSGADGRAVLSSNLPAGKLAYTVPVTDVAGVGGFVRPGDRVDVILTRVIPGKGADSATDKMSDVIVEAAPVLGVDQDADEKSTKPIVAKTATLEVDSFQAQKLALGIQLGTLSLALRNVTDQMMSPRTTVVPRQLSANNYYIPESRGARAPAQQGVSAMPQMGGVPAMILPVKRTGPVMTVVRGSQPSEYEVQRGS